METNNYNYPEIEPVKRPASGNEKRSIWREKVLPAFWSVGALLSIGLNVVLLVVVIVLGKQVFALKDLLTNDVVGGLYYNFLLMDQATIETTIQVEDSIPVQFDLMLDQETTVVLTEDTPIDDAIISLTTGGLNIQRAPTDIVLPAGTSLPIALDLVVPVDTEVPVTLTVPVKIPLNETELHEPFTGLQDVVSPYYWMLNDAPNTWGEVFCAYWGIGCADSQP